METPLNVPEGGGEKHPHGALAAATYLVFFLPNLAGKAGDPFVKHHQKQAVGLALFALMGQGVIGVVGWWVGHVVFGLWPLVQLLVWLLRFALLYLVIKGALSALAGEEKELPWIGRYAARLFS